jgi:hypothetical protein
LTASEDKTMYLSKKGIDILGSWWYNV